MLAVSISKLFSNDYFGFEYNLPNIFLSVGGFIKYKAELIL